MLRCVLLWFGIGSFYPYALGFPQCYQGLYSLSGKTSDHKISATRFRFKLSNRYEIWQAPR